MSRADRSAPDLSASALARRLDPVIASALDQRRLVGGVVLIAVDGECRFARAFGLADREAGVAIEQRSLFRLASVTKPIVSTAAMRLVAEGRLALDEPISRWLPEFAPRLAGGEPAVITTRQLLSHTAGLSYRFHEQNDDGPYARAGVSDGLELVDFDLADNLRRIASVPLAYPPGRSWRYSLAIDVLGALIERVVDAPLDAAVRALVTEPLGMDDTAFRVVDPERLVTPYVNAQPAPRRLADGEWVETPEGGGVRFSPSRALSSAAYPSGGAGMVGSAPDLLRLLETLRQGSGELLPAALVAEMARDQTEGLELEGMPGWGFGLGFALLRDPRAAGSPATRGSWQWGGVYGHSWFVDPAQRLSVVGLTNTLYEGMGGRFVDELRDAVYGA